MYQLQGSIRPGLLAPSRRLLLTTAAFALCHRSLAAETGPGIRVAAAADLRHALDEIAGRFTTERSQPVRVTYGSSGNLARQIAQGAPFELFLSADESFADRLVAEGHAEGPGFTYGVGRLALIARKDTPIRVEDGLQAIAIALAGNELSRFAIANPEHAPYGARAKEALQWALMWEPLQGRLVLAENVAQVVQYVSTGAATAGITALPLVKTGPARDALKYGLIPANMHAPLRQRLVLTKQATAAARAFYVFIASAEAQAILRAAGFEQP